MSTTKIPAVIYARYSTDQQDARSIDDQVRRCRRYADDKGFAVSETYQDAAQSGATLDRADMQRLLADARRRGGSPFRAVIVDDLSRLSRDLGDTWNIVFGELASADVRVIDATTGMSSDGVGARLTFGAMALVNDQFLESVRKQTHRGLEGRAVLGFSTGGRVYGYTTEPEKNPQDPERPRACIIINPEEAEVIRRIFRLYADGQSCKAIAALLNQEGVSAPYDGGHGAKRNGHGWPHTSVGNILRNERYIGHWVWNQSKWVKRPGQKSRRRVMRPEHEHVVRDVPELAIIDRELWDAVQSRARRGPKAGKGRPHGAGKHCHLFAGLLRCGICGNSMGVTGQKVKNGVRYAQLGCTTNNSRGDAVCGNGATISEKKVVTGLLGAIQELLTTPERMERFTNAVRKRLQQSRTKNTDGKQAALERQLREAERRVQNLVEGIANVGWTESLAVKLKAEEFRRDGLKAQVAAASQQQVQPALPSDEVIRQQLWNLMKLVSTDPVRGREALARCLRPFMLTPEGEAGEKVYRATGALNLSLPLIPKTPPSEQLEGGVSEKTLCGGRMVDFSPPRIAFEAWVPIPRRAA